MGGIFDRHHNALAIKGIAVYRELCGEQSLTPHDLIERPVRLGLGCVKQYRSHHGFRIERIHELEGLRRIPVRSFPPEPEVEVDPVGVGRKVNRVDVVNIKTDGDRECCFCSLLPGGGGTHHHGKEEENVGNGTHHIMQAGTVAGPLCPCFQSLTRDRIGSEQERQGGNLEVAPEAPPGGLLRSGKNHSSDS